MLEIKDLSVIYRVVKLQSKASELEFNEEFQSVREVRDVLYQEDRIPFIIDDDFQLPLHLFSPRLRNLLNSDELQARDLWRFITARENIIRMLTATEMGKTAAEALSVLVEKRYKEIKAKDRIKFKQIIGYMIKIVMEMFGYTVSQRRVQISTLSEQNPGGKKRFFTTASRYRKMGSSDLRSLLKRVNDPGESESLKYIFELILTGKTKYQKLYEIDRLTTYDVLQG